MEVISSAVFLSLVANRVIEAVVRPIKEYLASIGKEINWWWLIYVSWALGGTLAWLADLHLFANYLPGYPVVDQILTAIVVGGGANLINDIFDRVNGE